MFTLCKCNIDFYCRFISLFCWWFCIGSLDSFSVILILYSTHTLILRLLFHNIYVLAFVLAGINDSWEYSICELGETVVAPPPLRFLLAWLSRRPGEAPPLPFPRAPTPPRAPPLSPLPPLVRVVVGPWQIRSRFWWPLHPGDDIWEVTLVTILGRVPGSWIVFPTCKTVFFSWQKEKGRS